jgi:hypothetical protein
MKMQSGSAGNQPQTEWENEKRAILNQLNRRAIDMENRLKPENEDENNI